MNPEGVKDLDVAVIGAGAAGLMAAIFAARALREAGQTAPKVAAFDGAAKLGAKILISGGGRCNVTHDVVTSSDFNGSSQRQIARILRTFPVEQTVEFFRDFGVELKREETGKLFPVNDRARSVLDALVQAMEDVGARVLLDRRVTSIRRDENGFVIEAGGEPIRSSSVVIATGGRSVPKTGSDGAGYEFVRSFGHSVSDLFPALVPLLLPRGHPLTRLSGVSLDVELTLWVEGGKALRKEKGSMLFTHFGLSGPVVLDMSRHWIAAKRRGETVTLQANLLPRFSFRQIEEKLLREATERPRASLATVVAQWGPPRMSEVLVSEIARVPGGTMMTQLTKEDRRSAMRALTELDLPVVGDRGFDVAEVTAGGVPLSEIDLATMESRKCRGLFLCGEILDVDGKIGGYNFQWAWASGRLAGMGAGRGRMT